jgi:integrating conjugative element protein (TIGR03757 family)
MSFVSRFPASITSTVVALSLMIGELGWAAPQGDGPVRAEVFTAQNLPMQPIRREDAASAPRMIEVYALDGIERFDAILSEQLPIDPNAAKRAAMARIPPRDSAEVKQVERTAVGLVRAAEYGIDRYPAIVFDGHAVVYGVTDLGEALRHYRMWQGKAPR